MAEIKEQGGMQAELNVKKLQLHWLLQITKAINYNLPAAQLFEIYETVMRDQLKVQKLALYVNDTQWNNMLSYGVPPDAEGINLEERFNGLNALQNNNLQMPAWLEGFESIIPVYHNDKALAYAFIGDLQHAEIANLKEILPFIHTITNIIVVAIENKRLTRDTIRQAQLQRELELAARMQNMLFPAYLPMISKLEVSPTYLPNQQVGGDYYDYIELNDDELLICLADVSGKGISAALLMSNFQANLNAHARFSPSLPELITVLNRSVNRSAKGEKFITVFLAVLNTKTNMIRYINAGHNPPFIFQNNGFTLLEQGTTGLGMFEDLPFIHEGLVCLNPGGVLFCYTDGIIEQENMQGDIYGMDRLMNLIRANGEGCTMKDLNRKVLEDFTAFRGNAESLDDVTLLSCRTIG